MLGEDKNADYMLKNDWDFLTDWTFTELFPLQSMLREGDELKRYYSKRGYTAFMLTFAHNQHMNLWGKKENDFEI